MWTVIAPRPPGLFDTLQHFYAQDTFRNAGVYAAADPRLRDSPDGTYRGTEANILILSRAAATEQAMANIDPSADIEALIDLEQMLTRVPIGEMEQAPIPDYGGIGSSILRVAGGVILTLAALFTLLWLLLRTG